jgi:hypothetical protein
MARRSEFVALDVLDLTLSPNGAGTALIRRSKTDRTGEGARAYLSRETVRHVMQWLKAAKITEWAVFRRLGGRSQVGPRLHVDYVGRHLQAGGTVAQAAGRRGGGHQWAFNSGGGDAGSFGAEYRSSLDHAGGETEIHAHADAIWRDVLAAHGGMARTAIEHERDI